MLGELIGRDATLPWDAVEIEEIIGDFPRQERDAAVDVLHQMLDGDGPVAWATENLNVWLEDPEAARKRYEELRQDFPPWFVEE